MVELESETETTKLSCKINVLNKNVKSLMFSIDKLMEKLDKPVEKTPEEEKEKMDKIFAKNLSEGQLVVLIRKGSNILRC